MKKVAWLTSGFAPYRVPLWNALSDIVPLSVFLLSGQEKIRQWEREDERIRIPLEVIDGKHLFFRGMDWGLNLSYGAVKKKLSAYAPDAVIIGGYESPGFWAACHWARGRQLPAVMHYGSTALSSRTTGMWFMNGMKSRFIRQIDAYYTYGKYTADFLVRLGADASRIVVGQNLSDTSLTPDCTRTPGLPAPAVLYVGQLIPRKGVLEMVHALSALRDMPWHCTVVGTGPLRERMESLISAAGIQERFTFTGGRNAKETGAIYRQNDILVMPSLREVWGLVTNEALLSGLFVVGSNRAASCLELLRDGENGFVVQPTVEGLREGLRHALAMELPNRMAIRQSAAHITPEGEAAKIWQALQLAEHYRRSAAR